MNRITGISTAAVAALFATLSISAAKAQTDVWDGLARTTFDIATDTLRIPCAVLEDGSGAIIPGFAPAYALNFQLTGGALRLVEPLEAFAQIPESCLDTLAVDGNVASYSTQSAQTNSNGAGEANRFYTLELQANVADGQPVDFAVMTAESRQYIRPFFEGDSFVVRAGVGLYTPDFIYNDVVVAEARRLMLEGLTVYEAGNLEISCDYSDPLALLEAVGNEGGSTQYRLKASLTAADNDKTFAIECTAFNRDINRLELTIPIVQWVLSLS